MEIPWDKITTLAIALTIIICATALAAWNIASWNDVYTIFLIILAGIGFLTSGYYAGEAKAYRRIFDVLGGETYGQLQAKLQKKE